MASLLFATAVSLLVVFSYLYHAKPSAGIIRRSIQRSICKTHNHHIFQIKINMYEKN